MKKEIEADLKEINHLLFRIGKTMIGHKVRFKNGMNAGRDGIIISESKHRYSVKGESITKGWVSIFKENVEIIQDESC